ncbi:MAG: hydantoinase B/oxoprolinase family protein [Chloroflexi bacterium]|nr:MAG: hydantoinase B/oxoprolinase family protein [Chloroflexota bacterium]
MKAVKSQLSLDPVTLEIVWGRLQAVIDEAEVTLMRTAFSPIIREAFDFGVVLLDSQGGSVSQSQRSMPSFVGTLPRTMQAALERFPASTWQPGDVLGTNDPWLGTGHLPDMTMVRPVFRSGRIVAYVGCIGHWADIGGAIWSADSRELFEEGLRIPLSKIRNRGKVNDDLLSIVLANVRLPEQVRGDIYAQLATLDVGLRARYGPPSGRSPTERTGTRWSSMASMVPWSFGRRSRSKMNRSSSTGRGRHRRRNGLSTIPSTTPTR